MNRRLLATAMLAGLAAAGAGSAVEVVPRPPRDDGPRPPRLHTPRKRKGARSNDKRKPSLRERKKHKAKIAHASRRANRR